MELIGADINWSRDIKIGLAIGTAFILTNYFIPAFTIGIPKLTNALLPASIIIIGVVAPICEELGFRMTLLSALPDVIRTPHFFITALASSLFFMAAHYLAYTGGLYVTSVAANLTAFIGALFVGMILSYITYYTSIVPAIIAHASLNLFILSRTMLTIGGL